MKALLAALEARLEDMLATRAARAPQGHLGEVGCLIERGRAAAFQELQADAD
jgi:hypothetical protein